MTAAVSILGTATWNTTSGTKTVTATPAVGDLIILVTAHSGNTATTKPTDNNAGGSGTYTLVNTAVKATSADTMKVWVRNALITSATSTVFTHAPGTTTGGGIVAIDVQGMDKAGATAIVRSAIQSNQAAGGTPAPVFGATPSITNAIIGAVFNGGNPATLTQRSGYSEIADLGYNTPASGLEVMADNSGETSATITWGSTSATAFCSIVLELDARVTHATSGTPTGPGSTVAGSASRFRAFDTSGVLAAGEGAISGSAARSAPTVDHACSGSLTGQLGSISGTAARFRTFSSAGVLAGAGSAIAGGAARFRAFAATGALTAGGATVTGSAAHIAKHSTSGVLAGQIGTIAGTATRFRAHDAAGTLVAGGATIAGSAVHIPNHQTSGALAGQSSAVAGAAARVGAAINHATAGALTGNVSTVAGSAARIANHQTSGALAGAPAIVGGSGMRYRQLSASGQIAGPGSELSGTALRNIQHAASGDLISQGAVIAGLAALALARAPDGNGPPLRAASGQRPADTGSTRVAAAGGARPATQNTTRPTAAGGRRPTS